MKLLFYFSPSVRPARLVVYNTTLSDFFDKLMVIFKGILLKILFSIFLYDFHKQNVVRKGFVDV